jgi:HEAT repeat protein
MPGLRQWLRSKDLDSPNPEARRRGIEKLAASGDEEAVNLVAPLLQDPDPGVRGSAAAAIGEFGGPEAAHHLVAQLLHERELIVRRKIADAAARLHFEHTVPTLIAALHDEDALVRQAAAWAVRKIAWEFIDDAQKARVAVLQDDWSEAATFGPAAIEPLKEALIDGTQQAKRLAVETLAAIGTVDAFNALVAIMEDPGPDDDTGKVAAWGLRSFCWEWMDDAHLEKVATVLDG